VDESLEMLAYLRQAVPVHSSIEALRLAERFDGVVLASTLVNTFAPLQRQAFLQTAAAHMAPDATLVIQRLAPSWAETAAPEAWNDGPVHLELKDVVRHGDALVSATLVHTLGDMVAEQDFTARVLDDDELAAALADVGLVLDRALTADRRWMSARLST
jgi:hypothetical protein